MSKPDIEAFFEQANLHHPTTEFTAETFDTETAFLDTVVYKGTRSKEKMYPWCKDTFYPKLKAFCRIQPNTETSVHICKEQKATQG